MLFDSIAIPQVLAPYTDLVLARVAYLYPDVEWSFNSTANAIEIRFASDAHEIGKLRKELFFQFYREKIYQDTLPVRSRLYGAET